MTIARTRRRDQRFSGAAWLPGRNPDHRYRLIPMGDWHDSVVASDEETDLIRSTDQVGRVKPRIKKRRGKVRLRLDTGPANGCPLTLFLPWPLYPSYLAAIDTYSLSFASMEKNRMFDDCHNNDNAQNNQDFGAGLTLGSLLKSKER